MAKDSSFSYFRTLTVYSELLNFGLIFNIFLIHLAMTNIKKIDSNLIQVKRKQPKKSWSKRLKNLGQILSGFSFCPKIICIFGRFSEHKCLSIIPRQQKDGYISEEEKGLQDDICLLKQTKETRAKQTKPQGFLGAKMILLVFNQVPINHMLILSLDNIILFTSVHGFIPINAVRIDMKHRYML